MATAHEAEMEAFTDGVASQIAKPGESDLLQMTADEHWAEWKKWKEVKKWKEWRQWTEQRDLRSGHTTLTDNPTSASGSSVTDRKPSPKTANVNINDPTKGLEDSHSSEIKVQYVLSGQPTGWAAMAKILHEYDEEKVKSCKEDIDTILVFVSPCGPQSSFRAQSLYYRQGCSLQ